MEPLVMAGISLAGFFKGPERALAIDAANLGPTQATLVFEVPELVQNAKAFGAGEWTASVSVSSCSECPADSKVAPKITELATGTVSAKYTSQTAAIPGDMDLALLATSREALGNEVTCSVALRFHSEAGKTYRLHMTPHRDYHPVRCTMTFVEVRDGKEWPVQSAHKAMRVDRGFWKGTNLNICVNSAEGDASLMPAPQQAAQPTTDDKNR